MQDAGQRLENAQGHRQDLLDEQDGQQLACANRRSADCADEASSAALQRELETARQDVMQMTERLEKAQDQTDTLKAQLEAQAKRQNDSAQVVSLLKIEHERIWEEAHEAAEKIQRGHDDNQQLRQQLREAEQRLAELSAADQQLGVPTQDQEVSESPADIVNVRVVIGVVCASRCSTSCGRSSKSCKKSAPPATARSSRHLSALWRLCRLRQRHKSAPRLRSRYGAFAQPSGRNCDWLV